MIAPNDSPPALAARGIGVAFGGLRALDGVDLSVERGSIVGLIGPNGAGKTTLFDALSGFVPCEGRIWVNGLEVSSLRPHRRAAAGLGRSFQDAGLFRSMTVIDTLRVACELYARAAGVIGTVLALPSARAAERRATQRALELVDLLGLGAYRDKIIRELSTGTRRIVDLACVLAQRPSIVLLDEPSSGIAQRETEALGPLLRRLRDHTGCSMLLIEHDMPLLLGLAERVVALETGRVIGEGPPEEVVRHPEVIRSYLGGDPAAIRRSGAAEDAPETPAAKRALAGKKVPRAKRAQEEKRAPAAKRAPTGRRAPARTRAPKTAGRARKPPRAGM